MSLKHAKKLLKSSCASTDLAIPHPYTQTYLTFRSFQEAKRHADHIATLCPNPTHASLGLTEIFINAIEHGNLGIDYNEKAMFADEFEWMNEITKRLMRRENLSKFVEVTLECTPERVKVAVKDQGLGFDWTAYGTKDCIHRLNRNGRGILIARELGFDDLIYHSPGNKVDCIIYR